MPRPPSYREPARDGVRVALPAPPARRLGLGATVIGSMAASGVVGAAALGSAELAMLAGAGALTAAAHWVRALRSSRRHTTIARFLDDAHVIETPGRWTTPCGARRVRLGDDGEARLERLDPTSGRTLASFRAPLEIAPATMAALDVRERRVATLHGRALAPCCFLGLPRELGGRPALVPARFVRVLVGAREVRVERYDDDGELIGDTVHDDSFAAERQLAAEYGDHLGVLRDDPGELPLPSPAGWEPARPSRVRL